MDNTDSLPRDAQSILELAARSMFELFASASEGMLLVDRQARVVWINEQYKRFLPALGFDRVEFRTFRVRSNQDWHDFVFAQKRK